MTRQGGCQRDSVRIRGPRMTWGKGHKVEKNRRMFLVLLLSLPYPLNCVSIPSHSLYPPCPKDHWFCPLPSIKKIGAGAGAGAGARAAAGAVVGEEKVPERNTEARSGAGEESRAGEKESGECISFHSPCNGLCPDQTLW